MTKKLYLEDPYLLSCSSEVIGQTEIDGKPAIILDRTVFYPASAVPPMLRPVYDYNPLGAVIEAARAAILAQPVSWTAWLIALAGGSLVAFLGHAFFRHSRDEFADAL